MTSRSEGLRVSVAGLAALYDPFEGLGYAATGASGTPRPTLEDVRAAEPIADWRHPSTGGFAYDLGRLSHFAAAGWDDAITIGWRAGRLKVLDGHHRLGAACLLGHERILCQAETSHV